MAASTVTPSAPAAAPAAASTPASSPASTPANTGTPAGGTPAAGGNGAGAGGADLSHLSPAERIKQTLTERLGKKGGLGTIGEGHEVAAGATPDADTLAELTAEQKPFQTFGSPGEEMPFSDAGESAIEHPADATETEQQAAAEQPADPDAALFEDQPYVRAEVIAPKDLATAINASPELKAAIDANPALKNQLFANARRSEKLTAIEQYVRSPEEAKVMQERTGTFNNLSDLMGSINRGDLSSVNNFLTALVGQTILRDESGQPIINPKTGKPQTDGSMFRMLTGAYELRHSNLRKAYENEGNDEAVAAIDLLNGLQGIGASPASRESEQGLSPEQKAREDQISSRERALNEREQAGRAEAEKAFTRSVGLGRAEKFDGELDTLIKASSGLGDFNREAVRSSVMQGLKDFLKGDATYNAELKELEREPKTEVTRNKIVAVGLRYMRNNLGRIAAPIFAEAGAQAMTQQAEQTATHDARAKASRGEGAGAAVTSPTAPAKLDGQALTSHVVAEFVAKNNRQPDMSEILAGVSRYRLQASKGR